MVREVSQPQVSATSAMGTGWERTPWHATQRAAWEALKKAEEGNR
jgi:dsRNA-specific ribonuclease